MVHELLHRKILEHCDAVQDWFRDRSDGLNFPFYSSFDIRDSSFKVVPVDANVFPAGFNNICQIDREAAVETARDYLDGHYGKNIKNIVLLTEEHTQNPYYWNNIYALQTMLEATGREVRLAIPRPLNTPLSVTNASGQQLTVYSADKAGGTIDIKGFRPDLIISNNDFSLDYETWASDLSVPMNPPRELGWYRRRKNLFFSEYNQLATEFAETIGIDPWHIRVETELFSQFSVDDPDSRQALAAHAQQMISRIQTEYQQHGISEKPFLFIKNNSGTYGLGVTQVRDPEEILSWTYKARKKMKAAKGGREITEVIIQEGVPTVVRAKEGQSAEPVIYMIGCQLAGGFLRTHQEKGPDESLNSPGAVFQRLCVSDLKIKSDGCPMENVYGWIARISFLAVAREARTLQVPFRGYQSKSRDGLLPCG